MMKRSKFRTALFVALSVMVPLACGVTSGSSGSNTNWLKTCTNDSDCADEFSCLCGVCTSACEVEADACSQTAAQCADLAELGCAVDDERDEGACVPGCSRDDECESFGSGLACELGVCVARAAVEIDHDPTGLGLPVLAPLSGPARVAMGFEFACVTRAGRVWCWGYNDYGQIGVTPSEESQPITRIQDLDNVTEIVAGEQHVCVLDDAGRVYCWGDNEDGQVGPESAPEFTCSFDDTYDIPCQPTPTRVPEIEGATGLVANRTTTCATFDDGSLTCWGETDYIDGDVLDLDGGARSLSFGDFDVCAIARDTDELWCAGDSTPSFDNSGALQVDLAHDHAGRPASGCVLDVNGRVDCWGRDEAGQRGTGGYGSPTPEPGDPPAIDEGARLVKVGPEHACAILDTDEVVCWGKNDRGQTGGPSDVAPRCGGFPCQPRPTLVEGIPPAAELDLQNGTTCVLSEDAELYCWGERDAGTPYRVPGPWEGGNDECDGIDQAIVDEFFTLRQTIPRNVDCVADSDCVEVDLEVGCHAGCASAPLTPDLAEPMTAELARIDDTYCGRAEELGCNFESPACPTPKGDLACVNGRCVRFDPDITECEDACACGVLEDLAEAPPYIQEQCEGHHLVIAGFHACSSCNSSRQYFALANVGQQAFSGELTIELDTDEAGLNLPEPMTLTVSLEPGEHTEPYYFEFGEDNGSGYAVGLVVVEDNCTYQSEFAPPMVIPELPLCSE